MKEKLGNAFLTLIAIGLLLYLLISAVLDLTNKKDLQTVKLDEAFSLLEIEHSINGLIPIGTGSKRFSDFAGTKRPPKPIGRTELSHRCRKLSDGRLSKECHCQID